jgi:1-acyl-sn-glycerol-3-phosphate acyltransferase
MDEPAPVPPADLLPVQPQATLAFRLIRFVSLPILHLMFRIQVLGFENVPKKGNFIIIANHLNWLDSFAILAIFKPEPRIHFLGDTKILVTRRFQWFMVRSVGGFIPVNRSLQHDPALFRHVDRCLERGGVVALYPEGNYGKAEGELLTFKKGFAHFALENKTPVLPVAFSGTKDLWLRKTVRMVVGEPILPDGQTVDSMVELGAHRIRGLMPTYSEPNGLKLFRRRLTHLF